MLGIRHYSGVAIDLWQGDIRLFACDFMVVACRPVQDGKVEQKDFSPELLLAEPEDYPAHWLLKVFPPRTARPLEALAAAYDECLRQATEKSLRHLALHALYGVHSTHSAISPQEEACLAMQRLRRTIDERTLGRGIKRVSFILTADKAYQSFQEELFRAFPES